MLYNLIKNTLGPVLRTVFRPEVTGAELIPATGGAILASNHLSFSDSVFLPIVISRRVVFLGKSDYFTGRGVKGRMTSVFMRSVGTLPLDRSGGRGSDAALRTGLKVLNSGDLLGIYPEGTRSPDGRLYRGKTGVARLALEAQVPVIPVAMVGTFEAQPTGRRIPARTPISVLIGEPLDFSRHFDAPSDRAVLREMTDSIIEEIQKLSGQEYVDAYASVVKERIAREKSGKPDLPDSSSDSPR